MTLTLAQRCRSSGVLTRTGAILSGRRSSAPRRACDLAPRRAPAAASTRSTVPTCVPAWPVAGRLPGRSDPTLDGISEDLAPIAEAMPSSSTAASGCGRPSATGAGALRGGARLRRDHGRARPRSSCCRPARSCTTTSWTAATPARRAPVHRKFAALHRGRGWHGDAESFGAAAAILLGDLCLSGPSRCSPPAASTDAALLRAQPVFDRMRVELMAGQYLDVRRAGHGRRRHVERALRVARYKAAKYTIERPLQLGAALAGGAPAVSTRSQRVRAAARRGVPAARRRPRRVRRPGVTGKPAGDDLREGKRTVLVAATLSRTDARETALGAAPPRRPRARRRRRRGAARDHRLDRRAGRGRAHDRRAAPSRRSPPWRHPTSTRPPSRCSPSWPRSRPPAAPDAVAAPRPASTCPTRPWTPSATTRAAAPCRRPAARSGRATSRWPSSRR